MKPRKLSVQLLTILCLAALLFGQASQVWATQDFLFEDEIFMVAGKATPTVVKEKAVKQGKAAKQEKPTTLETTAESAILLEPTTGTIIFEKNVHKSLPPASVTKIMTLLIAVEAIEQGKANLKDRVKGTDESSGMGGSQIYLEVGEEFSLEELLISVAVGSANDASVAVAEYIGGSHDHFVAMMNAKAKALGLKDTKFVNAYGLPAEGHVTSAYDMAFILREAMKYPVFRRMTSIKEYGLRGGEFKLYNTNKLLWWYKGVDTGKTGWTTEAKYCLASSAEREGLRLIAVVMGSPEPRSHFRESIRLYNYGYARYRGVTVAEAGSQIKVLPVEKGTLNQFPVVAQGRIGLMVPKGQEKEISHRLVLPPSLEAPVVKGQKVGEVILIQKGKDIAKFALVAGIDVPKASLWQQLGRVISEVYN